MTGPDYSAKAQTSIGNYLKHLLILLVVMCGPFFMIGPSNGALLTLAAGAIYVVGFSISGMLRDRKTSRPGFRVMLVLMLYLSAVPIAAVGALLLLAIGWIAYAFDLGVPASIAFTLIAATVAIFVAAPVMLMELAPFLARDSGGTASRMLQGIRKQGKSHFHLSWIGGLATILGFTCILVFVASAVSFSGLEEVRPREGLLTSWELSGIHPVLPLALFTGAAMLALTKYTALGRAQMQGIVKAYADGADAPEETGRPSWAVLGLIVTGGWAATVFVAVYPIHLGLVAAFSSVAGISPHWDSVTAIDAWVDRQREAGKMPPEIVEALNSIGFWSPDRPGEGLAALVENPRRTFSNTCSVRTTAGLTDPASHAGHDWLTPDMAASDIKYCIVTTCASPVTWDAPPAVLLASSHTSRAKYWNDEFYIDIFAEGRAAAPGGYCNADGTLADEFQG